MLWVLKNSPLLPQEQIPKVMLLEILTPRDTGTDVWHMQTLGEK